LPPVSIAQGRPDATDEQLGRGEEDLFFAGDSAVHDRI
jgi:hypothetical protein